MLQIQLSMYWHGRNTAHVLRTLHTTFLPHSIRHTLSLLC